MKKLILITLFLCALLTFVPHVKAAFPVRHNIEQVNPNQSNSDQGAETKVVEERSFKSAPAKAAKKYGSGSKNQWVALLLCVLLGGIGIHRFYLGYTWQGIVQLLTGGGCGIWALIDLIRIITGNLQPKDGSYDQTI